MSKWCPKGKVPKRQVGYRQSDKRQVGQPETSFMAKWQKGKKAKRQNGKMANWQKVSGKKSGVLLSK